MITWIMPPPKIKNKRDNKNILFILCSVSLQGDHTSPHLPIFVALSNVWPLLFLLVHSPPLIYARYLIGDASFPLLSSVCTVSLTFSKPTFFISPPKFQLFFFLILSKNVLFIPLFLKQLPRCSHAPPMVFSGSICRTTSPSSQVSSSSVTAIVQHSLSYLRVDIACHLSTFTIISNAFFRVLIFWLVPWRHVSLRQCKFGFLCRIGCALWLSAQDEK